MLKVDNYKVYKCTIDDKMVKKIKVDDNVIVEERSNIPFSETFNKDGIVGNSITIGSTEELRTWSRGILEKENFKIDMGSSINRQDQSKIYIGFADEHDETIADCEIYYRYKSSGVMVANIDIIGYDNEEGFLTIGSGGTGIDVGGDSGKAKYSILSFYIDNGLLKLDISGNTAGLSQLHYEIASVPREIAYVSIIVPKYTTGNDLGSSWARTITINPNLSNKYIFGYKNPYLEGF